jgi:hypothetical protein
MSRARDSGVAAMQARLSTFLRQHPEESFSGNLVKAAQDPLKPLTENGRLRINPLLLILTTIMLFVAGLFLFCSFGQS